VGVAAGRTPAGSTAAPEVGLATAGSALVVASAPGMAAVSEAAEPAPAGAATDAATGAVTWLAASSSWRDRPDPQALAASMAAMSGPTQRAGMPCVLVLSVRLNGVSRSGLQLTEVV
jgi:hypothetical protein